jgi:hypothetical protein
VSAELGADGAVLLGSLPDPAAVLERRALQALEEAHQRMVRQQDRAMQLTDEVIQSAAGTLHGGAARGLRPGERGGRHLAEDLPDPVTELDERQP